MVRIAAALLALLIALPAWAEELRVPLKGSDELVIDLPNGWSGQFRRTGPDVPPTIMVVNSPLGALEMVITPIWPSGATKPVTPEELREIVRRSSEQIRPRAVESTIEISDLKASPDKPGYYYSATDRKPEPDGFKYMTQGAMGFNELRITFTILVNGDPKPQTAAALQMLRTLRRTAAPGPDGKPRS